MEILPGKEGLIHISELDNDYVAKVEDIVKLGDEVTVKVIEIDDMGRVNLSRKALLEGQSRLSDAEAKDTSAATHRWQKQPAPRRPHPPTKGSRYPR